MLAVPWCQLYPVGDHFTHAVYDFAVLGGASLDCIIQDPQILLEHSPEPDCGPQKGRPFFNQLADYLFMLFLL